VLEYRRCCDQVPKYKITYDCSPEKNQTIFVCKKHFAEEPFHRFIIKIDEL